MTRQETPYNINIHYLQTNFMNEFPCHAGYVLNDKDCEGNYTGWPRKKATPAINNFKTIRD